VVSLMTILGASIASQQVGYQRDHYQALHNLWMTATFYPAANAEGDWV